MTTEFQSFFESHVLSFLASCQPGTGEGGPAKVYATRRTLGQLAHAASTDTIPSTSLETLSNDSRTTGEQSSDEEGIASILSLEHSTRSVTPISECSMRETRSMRRARKQSDDQFEEFRMTLRKRGREEDRKQLLEDSESDEEEIVPTTPRKLRTRTPRKRQRVSSDSDDSSVPPSLIHSTVTSRGRVV